VGLYFRIYPTSLSLACLVFFIWTVSLPPNPGWTLFWYICFGFDFFALVFLCFVWFCYSSLCFALPHFLVSWSRSSFLCSTFSSVVVLSSTLSWFLSVSAQSRISSQQCLCSLLRLRSSLLLVLVFLCGSVHCLRVFTIWFVMFLLFSDMFLTCSNEANRSNNKNKTRNKDGAVTWKLLLPAQLPLHHNGPEQRPHYCWW